MSNKPPNDKPEERSPNENLSVNEKEDKVKEILERLNLELVECRETLESKRGIKQEIRSLDKEVGGLETDYQALKEEMNSSFEEIEEQELDEDGNPIPKHQQVFIHKKKRRKKGGLGKMKLEESERSLGYVERMRLKEDRSHENNDNGISR